MCYVKTERASELISAFRNIFCTTEHYRSLPTLIRDIPYSTVTSISGNKDVLHPSYLQEFIAPFSQDWLISHYGNIVTPWPSSLSLQMKFKFSSKRPSPAIVWVKEKLRSNKLDNTCSVSVLLSVGTELSWFLLYYHKEPCLYFYILNHNVNTKET